jgi:hypothetical protein
MGFPIKISYAFLFFSCVLHATPISSSLTWSFWLYLAKSDYSNYIWRRVRVMKLLIMQFSLNVRDKVSHSYKTTSKIIISCILIFTFLYNSREDKKVLNWIAASITWIFSALNFLLNQILIYYCLSQGETNMNCKLIIVQFCDIFMFTRNGN